MRSLVSCLCASALIVAAYSGCGDSTPGNVGDGGADGQRDAPGDANGEGGVGDGRVDTPWITDDSGVVRVRIQID